MLKLNAFIFLLGVLCFSCNKNTVDIEKQSFATSFESIDDFAGYYITPQPHKNTTFQELSDSIVHSGTFAHRAWIDGANDPSTASVNNNHRGYPTVQLYKNDKGSFQSPVYITLWVWVDMELKASTTGDDDWFSFATFSDDDSDLWDRTVLVNLSHDGFVHLQHTLSAGVSEYYFQTSTLKFPQKEWVELKIYLDFSDGKYAKVWQNGELVSHARIDNVENKIAQAHFGLYCPPQMVSGTVFNDDLVIEMVEKE